MRTAEADILIVPGWSGSGPDHWQSRWERSFKTARRVEQADWLEPDQSTWVSRIKAEIAQSTRPVVLVAHSLGVVAVVHALAGLTEGAVRGAFLVAPADTEYAVSWPVTEGRTFDPTSTGFAHVPLIPLPCASALVAPADDPYCTLDRAKSFATAWGSKLFEAGNVGHINTASGHGPWPDGVMQFGWFMRTLTAP
jgi:uncharacterized protein